MKQRTATTIGVILAATLLGGCHGIFGHRAKLDVRPIPFTESSGYAALQLTVGKKALDDHQYAEAITAFRVARLDPGLAPEALNGLAIAYAALGRTDLSERYFTDAIALAPGDDRFRANLARLYKTRLVPESGATALALAKAQSETAVTERQAAAVVEQHGPVAVTRPTGNLIRVSSGEVRIGAVPVTTPQSVRVHSAQAAIEVRKRAALADNSSVRVGFGAASGGYPIKVELSSSR